MVRDTRKGGEIKDMEPTRKIALKSSLVKAGKRNFFFDVHLATSGKRYLKITETRVPEEGEVKGKRSSFVIFPENVQEFQARLEETAKYLNA